MLIHPISHWDTASQRGTSWTSVNSTLSSHLFSRCHVPWYACWVGFFKNKYQDLTLGHHPYAAQGSTTVPSELSITWSMKTKLPWFQSLLHFFKIPKCRGFKPHNNFIISLVLSGIGTWEGLSWLVLAWGLCAMVVRWWLEPTRLGLARHLSLHANSLLSAWPSRVD